MIVESNGVAKRYSFWADAASDEQQLFEQFVATIGSFDNFVCYSYGSYEATFLRRMIKATGASAPVRFTAAPGCQRLVDHPRPCLFSHLFERSEGDWQISRSSLDGTGRIRAPKHRLAAEMGGDAMCGIEGEINGLQSGRLRGTEGSNRVPFQHRRPSIRSSGVVQHSDRDRKGRRLRSTQHAAILGNDNICESGFLIRQ